MLSVGFNVETVMLCSLADLPQNTSPCMKVIGPVGNPESTLHIPGLVPVDYKSGCNSFPTVVMLYKCRGRVVVQYFGNNYPSSTVLIYEIFSWFHMKLNFLSADREETGKKEFV